VKIPGVKAHVFWTPWWDSDHHLYDHPIEVVVHTPHWVLMVRPFSGFYQGGDRRAVTDGRKCVRRWRLDAYTPELFSQLSGPKRRWVYCVRCLAEQELCQIIAAQGGHEPLLTRHFVFPRHVWRVHILREPGCWPLSEGAKKWIKQL
jgi:hypothetical protein